MSDKKKSLGAKTLMYPTPCLLVGSYDEAGKANMAAVAWGGICNSKPASVAISLRAATYSHGGIMQRKAFTVTIPSADQVAQADFTGMASGRDCDKFAKLGWTAVKSDVVDAPYPAEAPMVIECKLVEVHELGLHTQFVGEIVDIKADEGILTDGKVDITKLSPILYAPDQSEYYGVGKSLGKAFSVGKEYK